jgi:hypothetical protein
MRSMRFFGATLTALALTLGTGTAGALTILDAGFGSPQGGAGPRSLAMGSTGASLHQGSQGLFFNPATLLPETRWGEVDLTLGVAQATEDRSVPLWDSFNSYVDDTIVATNHNRYGNATGGAIMRLPGTDMSIAVGLYDRYDFKYDYYEEYRNPAGTDPVGDRDQILQERSIQEKGALRSLSAGYSAEIAHRVQLGFAMHRDTGDPSREIQRVNYQTRADTVDTVDQELRGWGWSVGAWGRPTERVDVGVSFEGPFSVDGNYTARHILSGTVASETSMDRSVDYPGTLRFGATYHPRNQLRTTFAVEMERRFWESLDSPVASVFGDTLQVRDTWDLRVGLEHVFYNDLPVRFGFRYLENYADPESDRSIFSAGVGYHAAGFNFDVTGLLHRQTSRQAFLFNPSYRSSSGDNFQAPGTLEKVEDTILQLVVGASRSF